MNNVNLDEFDKMLNDYFSHHNKKFDFYLINCEFEIEFDINFTTNIEINYVYNIDSNNMKSYLLYYTDSFNSRGYIFYDINQLTINTINCRCNMTYEHYMTLPMHMCERSINMIIAKNPQLLNALDRSKNGTLIKIYSHIPFNNY